MSGPKKPLLLLNGKNKKFIVWPCEGLQEIDGLGVVDTGRLAGLPVGSKMDIAGKEHLLLEASLLDILNCIRRGPQWIMPKDSGQIVIECGIGPGKKVLEVGAGNAALTIVLAYFVGSSGRIVTYECNPKFANMARQNIEFAGMSGIVELREEDAMNCGELGAYDAVIMDVPQPWDFLEISTKALKTSGYLCAYVPTMNQAENIVKKMRDAGYSETKVIENLQRELVVGEKGTRPSFEMLGHTGYICLGRKIRA
jgi:tRNA (adenine57-N1/adenine58-N1)-methyltransferase